MAFEERTVAGFINSLADALNTVANSLDLAVRGGGEIDEPEGTRYVVFSDTLVTEWAKNFRGIASQLGGTDVKATSQLDVVRGGAQEQGERGQPDSGREAGSLDAMAGEEPGPIL